MGEALRRDGTLIPEKAPCPAPAERDPREHATGEALRECSIRLWRDLWQKVERLERENMEQAQTIQILRARAARARGRSTRSSRNSSSGRGRAAPA